MIAGILHVAFLIVNYRLFTVVKFSLVAVTKTGINLDKTWTETEKKKKQTKLGLNLD